MISNVVLRLSRRGLRPADPVRLRDALAGHAARPGRALDRRRHRDRFLIVFPLTFLSNAFVPADGLPDGLRQIAEWNPVSVMVAAVRTLFGNPTALPADAAWPLAHPVPWRWPGAADPGDRGAAHAVALPRPDDGLTLGLVLPAALEPDRAVLPVVCDQCGAERGERRSGGAVVHTLAADPQTTPRGVDADHAITVCPWPPGHPFP